jgi:O-antigen/teichoic acid export membrane protein
VRSLSLLGSAHVIQLLCSLLGTVLVFRSLEPADVGLVISLIAYNTVVIIPLSSAIAKIYSAVLVEQDSKYRASQLYWLGLVAIAIISMFPAGLTLVIYGDPIYAVLSGLLGIAGAHKMNLRHAENMGLFTRISIVRIIVGLALLGAKAIAAFLANPYVFAAGFVVEYALYLLLLPTRHTSGLFWNLRDWSNAIKLQQLRSVAKLLPTEFAAAVSLKYPLLMFGAMSMPEAAALYNAATRLPDAFNGLLMALFAGVRPNAYREASETEPAQFPYRSTHRFVKHMVWLTVFAMIVTPVSMPLLFGEFYRQAQLGAALYFVVSVTILMGIVQEVWMLSSGFFWMSAVKVFVGMITTIIVSSTLYLILGLEGAILGVCLGGAAQAIFSNLLDKRLRVAFGHQMRMLWEAVWPFGLRLK